MKRAARPANRIETSDGYTAATARPLPEQERAPSGALLAEVAFEVCNKLGGIYQVLRSKAPAMVSRWRNRYLMIGPYVERHAALEFEARRPTGWLGPALQAAAAQGLRVHHGHWLVPGRPRVLLLDHAVGGHELDVMKFKLWEHHGIDSPPNGADGLFDEAVSFGFATAELLRTLYRHWQIKGGFAPDTARSSQRVVAHFHEWLGGVAIPELRRERVPVASVFTTHATLLGRYMASADERFYDHLPFVDQAREAARFNLRSIHAVERACAHGAHVMTTVSSITGEECAQLLGRKPDLVLPNGLSIRTYNVGHEFQTMHATYKDAIHRFVMGHFFPSYSFDLDRTIYMFTSGRYEPRNKGFDVCMEAMARLNADLRAARLGVTVVFFIVTHRQTRSILPHTLQSVGVLRQMREVCDRITAELGEQLFRHAASGRRGSLDDLVDEYWALRLRRTQQAFRQAHLPPIVTHAMDHEGDDPVLTHIRHLQLFNRPDDPVKVVYHPEFISPVSPLWGIEYDQFVRGCHLGVFPSAYEPWGYTPLECLAMGVPAVTSDLAGFGRFVQESLPDVPAMGLRVLKRRNRSFQEASAELASHLLAFCRLSRRERITLRNDVERRSWEFDWSLLGRAYHWAHDLAMVRVATSV